LCHELYLGEIIGPDVIDKPSIPTTIFEVGEIRPVEEDVIVPVKSNALPKIAPPEMEAEILEDADEISLTDTAASYSSPPGTYLPNPVEEPEIIRVEYQRPGKIN